MKPMILAATLLAAVPAGAATKTAATKTAAPSQAQLRDAQQTLSLIVSALNSKDVPEDMKDGLFGCLYENPLGKIADGATKVWAQNAKGDKKLDPKNATAQLLVVAKVCGAPLPKPEADGKPAAKGR
jgi:hypothetical protein